GEDARLDGRPETRGPRQPPPVDPSRHRADQPAADLVAPDQAHQPHRAAERGHVGGGIARAPWDDLGGSVLEDEDRRFARDSRDTAIDVLVGDEIADDRDACVLEFAKEVEHGVSSRAVRRGPGRSGETWKGPERFELRAPWRRRRSGYRRWL